jgi:mannose-6-phosphate isomerase-like protein (cupin superfamily)
MNSHPFENGNLLMPSSSIEIAKLPWNKHPTCRGVYLKHLITGEATGNRLSCHLVKIDPESEITVHSHEGKTELHEIIGGSGRGCIESREFDYTQGTIVVIPADKDHSLRAGQIGLLLLAKVFPALL